MAHVKTWHSYSIPVSINVLSDALRCQAHSRNSIHGNSFYKYYSVLYALLMFKISEGKYPTPSGYAITLTLPEMVDFTTKAWTMVNQQL